MVVPISQKTRVGDRVLVDAELVSTRQHTVDAADGLFYYLVRVRGCKSPIPVLEDDLYDRASKVRMHTLDYEPNVREFAQNLRFYRHRIGMTQQELGKALGTTKTTVQNWEYGRSLPRTWKLPAVAAALGVTTSQLIEGDALDAAA